MHVDPDGVMEFARQIWKIADNVGELRIDVVLARGISGVAGTDLSTGLARYSVEQQEAVDSVTRELDAFGCLVRDVVEEYLRTEDAIVGRINPGPG